MYATLSADIVSSTSLSKEGTIELKQRIDSLFQLLEEKFPGFWGRQIKGEYIEGLIPQVSDSFRIALIIKSYIKSITLPEIKQSKNFQTYGIRIAIGIGEMRIVDKKEVIFSMALPERYIASPSKIPSFLSTILISPIPMAIRIP